MIKSLSPYYLNVPFVSPLTSETCSKYTLNIYVWDGLKINIPTTPVYSVTKNNPTSSTGNDKINISRLVNDYINFIPNTGTATGLIDAENQRWCKTSIVYTTENILDTDVEQLIDTTLVLKGYSYGMEGENVGLPINRILLDGTEFKVQRNGVFNLPILIDESIPPPPTITLNSVEFVEGTAYNFNYSLNFMGYPVKPFYKQTGDVNWISLGGGGLPLDSTIGTHNYLRLIPITGSVDFRFSGYDVLTNQVIFSNIITITI